MLTEPWQTVVANRIYLYDFQNNRPIFDYVTDASVGSNSKKKLHLGILTKDNAGNEFISWNYEPD
jgi:hypothetical protein